MSTHANQADCYRIHHMKRIRSIPSQRGAALVMSLMILLILTLLGVTAMGTSSLEEKMAGNTQEGTRAFEVGESGLISSLTNTTNFNTTTPQQNPYPLNSRSARVTTTWVQTTSVPRSIGGFDQRFVANHFQQASEVKGSISSSNIGLNTTITRGITQISPKN